MTLNWLDRWAIYKPEAVAIREGETGRSYTYSEALILSQKLASVFRNDFGIKRGSFVSLLASNEIETVILLFALARLGATLIPINNRNTEREIDHVLSDSKSELLIVGKEQLHKTTKKKLKSVELENLLNTASTQNLLFANFEGKPEDPALVIYTSGTTGAPKGALLSQKMIFWNSINTSLRLDLSQTDKTVIFLPFFHTGGWNVLTTPLLHRGGEVIFIKKFDPDLILKLTERHKATLLFGVPTTMRMIADSSLFLNSDLSSVRYSVVGGEPMPIPLIEKWHSKGVPVRQGYGLTEFGPNVFSLSELDAIRKIGSIGFPNFYIETKVVSDQGHECGADEIGELWLKGPSAMSGYLNNKQATAEAFVDGWLKTGDLVKFDSEGYFYVVGRKKEMYKSGGENVYPAEVEKVLHQIPGVKAAAVIGVPDLKWGEVGKAFLVVDHSLWNEDSFKKYCEAHLAKFKIPQHIELRDELPKSESGKILKKQLQ